MALGSLWTRLRRQQQQPSGIAMRVALNLVGFATWIPVVAWFNLYVAELTLVDGASMYPFMNEDKDSTLRRDVVFNYKWSPQEGLDRGMVVTLRQVKRPFLLFSSLFSSLLFSLSLSHFICVHVLARKLLLRGQFR